MTTTANDAWQTAVREIDIAAMATLLAGDPELAHEQIIHTRANGTRYGVLPLEMVNKSLEATTLLVEAGADPNRKGDGNSLPIHNASIDVMTFLLDSGADVNYQRRLDGFAPLHFPAQKDDLPMIEILLAAGADHSLKNADGKTPADLAIDNGYSEIAAKLDPSGG